MNTDEINEAIGKITGITLDFCNDLNAMHGVVSKLSGQELTNYSAELRRVVGYGIFSFMGQNDRTISEATAIQRCKAVLKAIDKCKEPACTPRG